MVYRIVLADDQPLIRQCVRRILAIKKDFEVVAEADDGLELLEILGGEEILPDLVIVDISMPRMEGIEAARRIKALYPDIKTLILSMHDDQEYLAKALSAGVVGYVVKDSADMELIPAIHHIRKGRTFISSCLKDKSTNKPDPHPFP